MTNLWQRLYEVKHFELSAECRNIPPTFDTRKGVGKVISQMEGDDRLTFFEKGYWRGISCKKEIPFSNALRWIIEPKTRVITLEHLRFGRGRPVRLFSLFQVEDNLFKSAEPYECKEDTYRGSVLFDDHYVQLSWQITGPKKNESLRVVYI